MWGDGQGVVRFSVGDARVSYANLANHQMNVTLNGRVVATYPISGGKPSDPTMNGAHIVLDRTSVVRMNSATNGVPVNSPDGYDELVYWDVHISDSGEYVHAAPWSTGSQGVTNVSHGCINLSDANAQAYFDVQPRRRRRPRGRRSPAAGARRPRRHGLGHRVVRLHSRERAPARARRARLAGLTPDGAASGQAVTQISSSHTPAAVRPSGPASVSRAASPVSSRPAPSRSAAPDGDEHVHVRTGGHGDPLAVVQPPAPEHRVALVDRDRAVVSLARRDRPQPALVELGVDVALLVTGRDAVGVGRHPHLDEVHVLDGGRVLLRVPDAGSRAHALREAGVELAVIALGVVVHEPALEHPGDDLHVLVRVSAEAGAGLHAVVVRDEQQAVVRVGRVVVVPEAEAMAAVEPVDLRVRRVCRPAARRRHSCGYDLRSSISTSRSRGARTSGLRLAVHRPAAAAATGLGVGAATRRSVLRSM